MVVGIAFGNLLQGVPFRFDDYLVSPNASSFWQLLNPSAMLVGLVSSAMITLQGGTYLSHRSEGTIEARAIRGGVGAALILVLVLAFLADGIWLQSIEGFRITSVIDMAALPDPLAKTVMRQAGAWMDNYGRQPLLRLLPVLEMAGALLAAGLLLARQTPSAFVASSLAVIGVIGTAGAPMHFPSLAVALVIMLAANLYPLLMTDASVHADHRLALVLFVAMNAGFVRGAGFVPQALVWRWIFSGWACLAALVAAIGIRFLR